MNKIGHGVGAVVVASLAIYNINQDILDQSLMAIGIVSGSYLPDLDAKYSYIKTKLKIIGKLYEMLPENSFTMHRGGMLHSIITLIPFILFYKYPFMLGVGMGVLGHHILDLFSQQGLRYFYPFKLRIRIK